MKILVRIIDELPIRKCSKYVVDINLLLKEFIKFEINISDTLFEEFVQKGLIGSAISYLENIEGLQFLEEGNSFDWMGRMSHDFHYMMGYTEDHFYIVLQINKGSDVRCHSYNTTTNNSYTDAFLLKFADVQDFFELIDEVIIENMMFEIEVEGRIYLVNPQIQSENLRIQSKTETGYIDIPGINAENDEELKEQIIKHLNNQKPNSDFQLIKD